MLPRWELKAKTPNRVISLVCPVGTGEARVSGRRPCVLLFMAAASGRLPGGGLSHTHLNIRARLYYFQALSSMRG